MRTRVQVTTFLLGAALAFGPALAWSQETTPPPDHRTAKQEMRAAGRDTKDAARDTGRGVKKGTKHAYRSTKRGTKKAWHKTKNTARGAKNGAENGARQPTPEDRQPQ